MAQRVIEVADEREAKQILHRVYKMDHAAAFSADRRKVSGSILTAQWNEEVGTVTVESESQPTMLNDVWPTEAHNAV